MARLHTETNVKRFAVWRIDGHWHVLSAGELEVVGIMDLSSYEPEPPRVETWFGQPVGFAPQPSDPRKQRVVVHDTATETYYHLFYLGEHEAVDSSIPDRDYLKFGLANWPDFDESLVYSAVEAVKAYQAQLKEKREAERKFKEIQQQLEADYIKREYKIMQAQTKAFAELEKWYDKAVAQARADLGLPPESDGE